MSAVVSICCFLTKVCSKITLLFSATLCLVAMSNNGGSAESTFEWFGFSDSGENSEEPVLWWSWSWIPFFTRNTDTKPIQPKSFLQQWKDMVLGAVSTTKSQISILGHHIWACCVYCLGFICSTLSMLWETWTNFDNWRFLYVFLILSLLSLTGILWVVFYKRNTKLGRRLSGVVSRLTFTNQRKHSTQSQVNSSHIHRCLIIRVTLWLVVVAAALSIPWEFVRLYQKEQAKRAARVYAGLPPDCEPSKLTLWQTIKSGIQWHFSWADHNPCERYYHAVLVDPIWEVTPMMVLSSVIARCILHPLELFSSSLGRSLKLFFTQIPSQWQPIIMVMILVTFLAFLLMTCRYRIRLPMLFVFEPRTPTSSQVKSRRHYVRMTKAPSVGTSVDQGSKPVKDTGTRKSRSKKDHLCEID